MAEPIYFMYAKRIKIENVGVFASPVSIDLPFNSDGTPKPIIFVGRNGAGKTTVLSHLADALQELAAPHYQDVLPQQGVGHAYFKLCGSVNQRAGTKYGFCYLSFCDGTNLFHYADKSGRLSFSEFEKAVSIQTGFSEWKEADNVKLVSENEVLKRIFRNEVFAYFPAHRFEFPSWLNSENPQVREQFTVKRRYSNYLQKPIVVTESADINKSWLLDVVLDHELYKGSPVWNAVNEILREILGSDSVRFGIGQRGNQHRIAICDNKTGSILIPSIGHLSGGQATLLNLALTILRYADGPTAKLEDISGIVLIDEIEAHLHTRLQTDHLPRLLRLCPKLQLILTSHSPLFLLGMEKVYGKDGFEIVELPSGVKVQPKEFEEYASVLEILNIDDAVSKTERDCVVFVEGETDRTILLNAWEKLFSDKTPAFEIVNAYDSGRVRVLLSREELYSESPSKTFLGLFDFDSAFDDWNNLAMRDKWQLDPASSEASGLLIRHTERNGFAAILPVPAERANYASRQFGSDSCVSIEMLFDDSVLGEDLISVALPGNGRGMEFRKSKKSEFAARTASLPKEAFGNFVPLFSLIEKVVQSCKTPTKT